MSTLSQPQPRSAEKILIVEDTARVRVRLEDFLASHNFLTRSLPDGQQIGRIIDDFQPDLLLLDVLLPGPDGFEVLRDVRTTSSLPVIMLTACSGKDDRIKGLDQGADDYLGKPFHFTELLARIRAVLRRSKFKREEPKSNSSVEEFLKTGPVSLDISRHKLVVTAGGQEKVKGLSSLEFKLFFFFMSQPETILSRDKILWHLFEGQASVENRSLTVYVNRLRKILEELGANPGTIGTVWGSGYKWRLL
ncbi:MAG: response regulator transcription factor [Deltaproteobacteria bacterium]|jgi:DNA-binding response OmpR family regulator|nr:response regulator transcription factor [Deltaproteobacteria bacterium]